MEFHIDNLVLVKRGETFRGITRDGLVQIDSKTRQIRIFCEDRMTQFIIKADEISPHLEDSVGEIILRFKPDDPQQKDSLKLSLTPNNAMYYKACRNWLLQFFTDCGSRPQETSSSSWSTHSRYIPH